MKVTALALLFASVSAIKLTTQYPKVANCVGSLDATEKEMKKQMDLFSRNFDKTHYDNAVKILGALKGSGFKGSLPKVSTWELYDKSFTWPKIRQYESV